VMFVFKIYDVSMVKRAVRVFCTWDVTNYNIFSSFFLFWSKWDSCVWIVGIIWDKTPDKTCSHMMFGVNNNVCVVYLSFDCVLSSKPCQIILKSIMKFKIILTLILKELRGCPVHGLWMVIRWPPTSMETRLPTVFIEIYEDFMSYVVLNDTHQISIVRIKNHNNSSFRWMSCSGVMEGDRTSAETRLSTLFIETIEDFMSCTTFNLFYNPPVGISYRLYLNFEHYTCIWYLRLL